MRYDFDEIIDRRNTDSENVEGFRSYMFSDEPGIELPVPDDELIRMWVADMEFAVAPEICESLQERIGNGSSDTRACSTVGTMTHFQGGAGNGTDGTFQRKSWSFHRA